MSQKNLPDASFIPCFTMVLFLLIAGCSSELDPNASTTSQNETLSGIRVAMNITTDIRDVNGDGLIDGSTTVVDVRMFNIFDDSEVPLLLGNDNTATVTISDINSTTGEVFVNENGNYGDFELSLDETVEANTGEYAYTIITFPGVPSYTYTDSDNNETFILSRLVIAVDRMRAPDEPWFPTNDTPDPLFDDYLFVAPDSEIIVPKDDQFNAPVQHSEIDPDDPNPPQSTSVIGDETTYYNLTDNIIFEWDPSPVDMGDNLILRHAVQCINSDVYFYDVSTEDIGSLTVPMADIMALQMENNPDAVYEDICLISVRMLRSNTGMLDPFFSADSTITTTTLSSEIINLVLAVQTP